MGKATLIHDGLVDPNPTIIAIFYEGRQEKHSTTVVDVLTYNFLYSGQLEWSIYTTT